MTPPVRAADVTDGTVSLEQLTREHGWLGRDLRAYTGEDLPADCPWAYDDERQER